MNKVQQRIDTLSAAAFCAAKELRSNALDVVRATDRINQLMGKGETDQALRMFRDIEVQLANDETIYSTLYFAFMVCEGEEKTGKKLPLYDRITNVLIEAKNGVYDNLINVFRECQDRQII